MPLERVSQSFKDISMSFQANPLNEDLIGLKNESAIARSIRNIVFTHRGEKFFDPDFGSDITKSLFENVDEVTAQSMREDIENSINNYEPRVDLIDVEVNPDYDNNNLEAIVTYEIVGIDVPPQQLEFVLLPTR